jgi:hypothetical protein
MDAEGWLVGILSTAVLFLILGTIYIMTRVKLGPEYSNWVKETEEFAKQHPVWNVIYTYIPFPISTQLQIVAPTPPKFKKNDDKIS